MNATKCAICAIALGLFASGCIVKEAPASESPANPPAPPAAGTDSAGTTATPAASNPECSAQQRACTDKCKAAAPDEASRQPCYNNCLREADTCAGR